MFVVVFSTAQEIRKLPCPRHSPMQEHWTLMWVHKPESMVLLYILPYRELIL